jgi:hypothetical protein
MIHERTTSKLIYCDHDTRAFHYYVITTRGMPKKGHNQISDPSYTTTTHLLLIALQDL